MVGDLDNEPEGLPDEGTERLLAKAATWDAAIAGHLSKWRREAKESYDLVAGEQWTDEDKQVYRDAERLPLAFNRIGPIIDAVSGAEVLGRQQVQYYPREIGDAKQNEDYTKGAVWVRDLCDADQEESDSFRDVFICGIGATETRLDYSEDPKGQMVIERVDPLELGWDATARKNNLVDARYIRRVKAMTKAEFRALYPGAQPDSQAPQNMGSSVNHVGDEYAYADNQEHANPDLVYVREYQWFEREHVYVVQDPETQQMMEIPEAEYRSVEEETSEQFGGVRQERRRYHRMVVAGAEVLDHGPLPDGEFTIKFITGKRDRNKGTWYGLVRPLKDPQKWSNAMLMAIIFIMGQVSKGGAIAEEDVATDRTAFANSLTQPGVTWVRPGALAGGKIDIKPSQNFPAGLAQVMEYANSAMQGVTGINQELLGMVERDQPGVLEYQRKQAAYAILAQFFDSKTRYHKLQGRLMLKYITGYLAPAGVLFRITNPNGTSEYKPIPVAPDAAKFDVIVGEAPAGPNDKIKSWGVLQQLLPILTQTIPVQDEFWQHVADIMPLNSALTESLKAALGRLGQQMAQQGPDPMAQAMAQAELEEKGTKSQLNIASAAQKFADAEAKQAGVQMNALDVINRVASQQPMNV